jgi:xylulokinase
MSNGLVLAYDLGTSGCKAALVDDTGHVRATDFRAYPTTYPQPGWHEQRPGDWWDAIVGTTRTLLGGEVDGSDVIAMALSGQSLAMVPVNAAAEPLIDSVPIWSDSRGERASQRLFKSIPEPSWYELTGNGFPAGLYTIFKIAWLARAHPAILTKTHAVLGSKDWINARLTGRFATDHSYASGSGAYDLRERAYDATILEALGVRPDLLPVILPSHEVVGGLTAISARILGLRQGLPIVTGGVDNSCMALGAGLLSPGAAYLSLGSSNWISVADKAPVLDIDNRPFVFDHVVPGLYVSALSTFGGGSSLSWLANLLGRSEDIAQLLEEAGASPIGSRGLVCVPTLSGGTVIEGGSDSRGAFLGLDLGHCGADLARSVVEGVALSLERAARALFSDIRLPNELVAVGGGARSDLLLTTLADLLDRPVVRTTAEQSCAALGAAALAFVGTGIWDDLTNLQTAQTITNRYEPSPVRRRSYEPVRRLFEAARAATQATAALRAAVVASSPTK